MKIKEYKEMMTYLTRPKATQEEAKATWNKREAEFNEERKQKLAADKDMETYVKNTTANNKTPGTFKKLVKEDEAMEKRGQQTVALTNTARGDLRKQIKNGNIKREDMLLKEDDNGLMVNKNRTIAIRDSFIAKQFNRALGVNEPEATPELSLPGHPVDLHLVTLPLEGFAVAKDLVDLHAINLGTIGINQGRVVIATRILALVDDTIQGPCLGSVFFP